MSRDHFVRMLDRLSVYAHFSGEVEGAIYGVEKGWISAESCIERIRKSLTELDAETRSLQGEDTNKREAIDERL